MQFRLLELAHIIISFLNKNFSGGGVWESKENEAPEPHHDNHDLLSARIGITASSAAAECERV